MKLTRRQFLSLTASASAGSFLETRTVSAGSHDLPVRAVAFDAFPIFDPRPIFELAEETFPGRGAELSNEWRTRQFEYTWLRVVAQHYADFWRVTEDALKFAAARLNLELRARDRDKLMNAYLELKLWPDVLPAVSSLKRSGLRLALLSNFTLGMLKSNIKHAGLSDLFEHVLSTDQAKTYKPDPRAYQLGIDSLKLKRQEILFVAFAGWDAAGAKLFGYPTFWVNRQKLPVEILNATPDGIGESLSELLQFVAAR